MLTHEQRAEIARRNGSRSTGPKTEQGKLRACRSSLRHGLRASKLAEFVPPNSATLNNEDRQQFFTLYDQNLAKYCPNDAAEKAVVREITNAQWANLRIDRARQARLNAEAQALGGDINLACEVAYSMKAMVALRHEFNANARNIAQAERRLKLIQRAWQASHPAEMTSENERSQPEPTQPVENTAEPNDSDDLVIRIDGPLTRDVIEKYRKLFPNRNLTFTDAEPKIAM